METRAVRLPDRLVEAIDRLATARGTTHSDIIRKAIEAYCETADEPESRSERLRRLVNYPGSGRTDGGARSEEYLRAMFDAKRRSR